MKKEMIFELQSKSPIEVVYGLSEKSFEILKAESGATEGYGWCILLDETADQREEFLSGNDLDDAILTVTDVTRKPVNFRFMSEDEYELDEQLGEDLRDVIKYKETVFQQAGLELDPENIAYIVVARTELKFRSWKCSTQIDDDFDEEKLTIKAKNRDSDVAIASEIYGTWASNFENSITDVYYDGARIEFETDFTSYAPEFLCLRKTSKGWVRDPEVEHFFEGID